MNDDVLYDKLQILLESSPASESDSSSHHHHHHHSIYENERHLAACSLLIKLPQEKFEIAWEKYGKQLTRFAKRLLLLKKVDNSKISINITERRLQTCYVRMIAQMMIRLQGDIPNDLGSAIFHSWHDLVAQQSGCNKHFVEH